MARQKKPKYEYVERLGQYRKRIKDVDGKYIAIYGRTPDELTAKLESALEAIEEGKAALDNPRVKDYGEKWLSLVTADMQVKNKEIYTAAIRLHVLPVIGELHLREVTPDDARRVMIGLSGKSASLQSKVLNTMRKMFDNAIENDLIAKNPCAKLKNTGYKAKEKTALSADQMQILLDAVKGTRAETFVALGLYTGMRREEILGLQWSSVELTGNAPHIKVERALRWEHSRAVVSNLLKSNAASRTIPIPKPLLEHLRSLDRVGDFVVGGEPLSQTQFKNLWKIVTNRQTGEKTYTVPYSNGEKATFVRELGGKSRGGNFRYTIDFDVSPHILRHTYITNLILSGVDLKTVQYVAGHADISLTLNIYTHLVERSPEKMLPAIDRAFEVKTEVN